MSVNQTNANGNDNAISHSDRIRNQNQMLNSNVLCNRNQFINSTSPFSFNSATMNEVHSLQHIRSPILQQAFDFIRMNTPNNLTSNNVQTTITCHLMSIIVGQQ